MNDAELLRQFTEERSEEAFRMLVQEYSAMVYSVCFRSLKNEAKSEDAAQAVFITLAKKADSIRNPRALSAWLFRAAKLAVLNMKRMDARRVKHEAAAAATREKGNQREKAQWKELLPYLNDVLSSLGRKQQGAVVDYFFRGKTHKEIAGKSGCSEDAVRKRISRSLEKMRRKFGKKGIIIPMAALVRFFESGTVEASPADLASSCSSAALQAVKGGAGPLSEFKNASIIAKGVMKMMMWTKLKLAGVAIISIALAAGGGAAALKILASAQEQKGAGAAGEIDFLAAFPGAEGYGGRASGGRGGKVIKVTNLKPKGPGSFIAALGAKGPRIIIFDVSGVVPGERYRTGNGDFTIACQTAPGPGIAFEGMLEMKGVTNAIIRHMRIRYGRGGSDAVRVTGCTNVIFDHVSVSWGADESLSPTGSKDVTLQWCTVNESRLKWEGGDEPHNFGMLVSNKTCTLSHNLIAHHTGRVPNCQYGVVTDFRNNVLYNVTSYSTVHLNGNVVNNYLKEGKGGLYGMPRIYHPVITLALPGIPAKKGVHRTGNYMCYNGGYCEDEYAKNKPTNSPPVTTYVAEEAYKRVTACSGALPRDEITGRIMYEVRHGTGMMDKEVPPGDWRARMKGGTPKPDGDSDGMPDEWEKAHNLNPSDPSDANKTVPAGASPGDRHKGYTYIEYYINELADLREAEALTAFRLNGHNDLDTEPPKPEWKPLPKSIDELVTDIESQNYARIAKTEALSKKMRQVRSKEGKSKKWKELHAEVSKQGGGKTGTGRAWKAIWAFKDAGPAAGPAAEKLAKVMDTNDNRQALFTAWALGMIAPFADETVVVPVLIKGLERTDYVKPVRNSKWNMNPRGFIAWALGRFGPRAKEAVPALAKTMHGKDGWARQPAAWALRKIGKDAAPATEALIKALSSAWGGNARSAGCGYHAAHALARIGESALPAVIKALETVPRKGRSSRSRCAAAVVLGLMGSKAKEAVPALIKVLSEDQPLLKTEAALALSKIDPSAEGVVPALAQALTDTNYAVRNSVAQALGGCGSAAKDAIPALETALADRKKEVRYSAAEALGRIGENSVPVLIQAFENGDAWTRKYAARALGDAARESGSVQAVDALIKGLQDNNAEVRREAVLSLALIESKAGKAASSLKEALGDADYIVRYAAEKALTRISGE